MKYTRFQDILDFFNDNGIHVFRINDVAKFIKKPNKYVSLLLSKNQKIKRIEKGLFCVKEADIYEIASNIIGPSYISALAALRYYDLTTQLPIKITVVTIRRHKRVYFNGYDIEFVTFKRERVFGYLKSGNAYVASPEKAFVDSLYTNRLSYDEIVESFDIAIKNGTTDLARLKSYALGMKSHALISRLGLVLEHLNLDAKDLYRYRSKGKVKFLGYNGIDKRWGII